MWTRKAQKFFALSPLSFHMSVKSSYDICKQLLSVASFQVPAHHHLLKERDLPPNLSIASISWSLSIYKASSPFGISLQLMCYRNLFQNQSFSVLSSLLYVICETKLLIAIEAMDPATSMVLESALSAIFQQLLDKLVLPFLKSLGLPFGVEREAKRLKSTLSRIEALHTDTEERQIREESVRLWLSDLKDVADEAKDILDELEYIALRSNIEAAPMQLQTRKRKLADLVPHFISRFSSNFKLGSRIMKIRERLDEIERESNQFHLKVIHLSQIRMLRMRDPSSSIVDESTVFGREANKEKVVGLLASDDSSAKNVISVNELRDMIHLRGSLHISGLENVISVEEAKEAELKNKQKIDRLVLHWKSHDAYSRQEGIEEEPEVLNALQPHTNLKYLEIACYYVVRFPTWLGDSSFSKLVSIHLFKCKCRVLPPFGQLPFLNSLSLTEPLS